MNLFLFIVWCASVAGDTKTYITAASTKEEALSQIPYWFRQDYEIRYATLDEAIDLGCVYYKDSIVVFEDKFFEYNHNTNRMEYDSDVNYTIHPELYTD
jgi:hypothetical protein